MGVGSNREPGMRAWTVTSSGTARLPRAGRVAAMGLLAVALAGCGSGTRSPAGAGTASVPAYVREPFSAQQELIAEGARLIVSEGCSACHLDTTRSSLGPNFDSLAGHVVTLRSGRRVLVDESFLRESLRDPAGGELAGYDPAPMLQALAHLGLAHKPRQVAALAAFIEEVGPEPQ